MQEESKPTDNKPLIMLPGGMALLKDSIDLFKERFIVLISLTILPLTVVLLGVLLFIPFVLLFETTPTLKLVFITPLLVLAFIAQIIAQIGVYEAVLAPKALSFKEALIRSREKLLPYLGTAFLYVVILAGGFILFIVPAFIFLVWFMLSLIIVVAEDKSALDALKQSKEYVKGYFGPVLMRWLFLVFVFIVFFILVSIISSAIFGADSPHEEGLTGALAILISPIGSIYFVKLYQHIKQIKN